ncbi:hypothetical protein CR513_21936, partial [Mucuna pruriens]
MPITKNQASSTNEGEEDTLQRLLRTIVALRAASGRDRTEREEDLAQPFWRQLFCKEIDETPIPLNFREVVVEPFDGQDPYAHLQTFQTQMYISGGNDRLSYKLFPGTLRGVAMQWMTTLPPKSIQTFKDLPGSFVSQFAANKIEGESLKSYLARFNNTTVRVDDPDQKFFVKAFQKGLRARPFSDALALRKPVNMEIHARAEKHVGMEEDQCERRKLERRSNRKDVRHLAKAKEDKHPILARANEHTQRFTPLTEKRTQILREICHTSLLEYPQGAKGKVMGKDKDSWCDFHRAFGHITEDCWALRMQIEKLATPDIRRECGKVGRHQQEGKESITSKNPPPPPSRHHSHHFWRRGVTLHKYSDRGIKRTEEGRRVERIQTVVMGANVTPLGRKEPAPTITFDDRDMKRRASGQDEPMVISVVVAEYKIERVLIDQGSSANILYWSTVQKM